MIQSQSCWFLLLLRLFLATQLLLPRTLFIENLLLYSHIGLSSLLLLFLLAQDAQNVQLCVQWMLSRAHVCARLYDPARRSARVLSGMLEPWPVTPHNLSDSPAGRLITGTEMNLLFGFSFSAPWKLAFMSRSVVPVCWHIFFLSKDQIFLLSLSFFYSHWCTSLLLFVLPFTEHRTFLVPRHLSSTVLFPFCRDRPALINSKSKWL